MRYKVFISSVQLEFASERLKLSEYLQNDALFRRFFDVFIFESIPAQDRTAFNVYIEEVKQCDIFITLLGKKVGFEFEDGSFPTQQEFETATKYNKYRLVFLLNVNENDRHKKINLLIKKVSEDLIYGKFSSYSELVSDIYSSLVSYLIERGELRTEPFDKSVNKVATLSDISNERIEWFLQKANTERGLLLDANTSKDKLLIHLNLLNNGMLSNAAILLFGNNPQRYFLTSEVKCAHFH